MTDAFLWKSLKMYVIVERCSTKIQVFNFSQNGTNSCKKINLEDYLWSRGCLQLIQGKSAILT